MNVVLLHITGIWMHGSAYFVVKPIKYGLVLTFSPLIVPIIPVVIQ
jgi:hypothetical protein